MTNEEQWELFGYCTSVGLTPGQGKVVVTLAASEGMTIDELDFSIYGTTLERYHPISQSHRISLKILLSGIRSVSGRTGITIRWEPVERTDALQRVKVWRRHIVAVDRVPEGQRLSFKRWKPPIMGNSLQRKKKAA